MDYDMNDNALVVPDLDSSLAYADNPDQRTPCVLCLDTSYSMAGEPIMELNNGLQAFKQALTEDRLAARRVEVSIVTFGSSVDLVQDFVTAGDFVPPTLRANGATPMGAAIDRALDRVGMRKTQYRDAGVPHTRPWVFLITDGAPTDDWQQAADRVHRASAAKQVALFPVGVQGADMQVLSRIAAPGRPPVQLAGLKFRELFQWLSVSLAQVSRSSAGATIKMPPRDNWEDVEI